MSSSEINTLLQVPQRKHCLAGGVSDAEKGVLLQKYSLHFTVLLAEKSIGSVLAFLGKMLLEVAPRTGN